MSSENKLINLYLAKCRICLRDFHNFEKYIHITKLIRERFLAITHMELKDSVEEYSNVICETCDMEMRNIQIWRKEAIKKQNKLLSFVENAKANKFAKLIIEHVGSESEESELSNDEVLSETDFEEDDGEEERFKKFNIKRYSCELCSKKTLLKSSLERHMQKFHRNKQLATKLIIKSEIIRPAQVNRVNFHKPIVARSVEPKIVTLNNYICDCGEEFQYHRDFLEHKKTHKGTPQNACHLCDKKYTHHKDLLAHIRRKHTEEGVKPVFCEICGNQFSSNVTLRSHKKYHMEPEHACSFPGCDQKFYRREKLTVHEKRHVGQKDFMCHICNKSYYMANLLRRHIAVAHENFRVHCFADGCAYTSSWKDSMRNHLYTHHRELPEEMLNYYLQKLRELKAPTS